MKIGYLVVVDASLSDKDIPHGLERDTLYVVRDVGPSSGCVRVERDRDGVAPCNRYSPDCFRVVGMMGAISVAPAA